MSKLILKRRLTKSYTPEFRLNAIQLAQNGEKCVSKTARDLGVPLATLHTWIRKTEKGEWSVAGENITAVKVEKSARSTKANISQKLHEQLSAEQKKSAELERQVRRLTQEREILKNYVEWRPQAPVMVET